MAERPWWLCPNTPRCPHGAVMHDVEDYEDESPRCCAEGCDCGKDSDRKQIDTEENPT